MDASRISTRYAKAIYEYALEKGEEARLYEEMKMLADHFLAFKSMRKIMEDPTVLPEEKKKILTTAAGISVSDSFKKLIDLVILNKRESYVQFIALSFQVFYRKKKGIIITKLITAEPVTNDIENQIKKLISTETNEHVDLIVKTDSSIIGGYILELEDKRLDSSVKNQLNQLRQQLVDMNSKNG